MQSAVTLSLSGLAVCVAAGLSVAAIYASGPSEETRPVPARTVSWFAHHEPELRAQIRACRDNPGDRSMAPACENATQADVVLALKKARESL
jgi:hypothetical protein